MGETQKLLLFRKWDLSDIAIQDKGLKNVISFRQTIMPLTFGRSALKRFNKAEVNIVERLVNKLMHFGKKYAKNTGRMDGTRIVYGGTVYHVSVDVAPVRRIDLALKFIADGVREATFSNPKTIEEHLSEHLILAAANDPEAPSVKKKHELERIAQASR